MEMARNLLLQSHSELISEYSGDQFEMVMAQIAKENELKESLGLLPTLEEPAEPQPEPAPEPDEEDEEAEEGDDQPSPPVADADSEASIA